MTTVIADVELNTLYSLIQNCLLKTPYHRCLINIHTTLIGFKVEIYRLPPVYYTILLLRLPLDTHLLVKFTDSQSLCHLPVHMNRKKLTLL